MLNGLLRKVIPAKKNDRFTSMPHEKYAAIQITDEYTGNTVTVPKVHAAPLLQALNKLFPS